MRELAGCRAILAAAAVVGLAATPARAAPKVWVSGDGVNSISCGVTSPCRTLQQAHDNVTAGGEIGVIGPGEFGPLTITKAISIVSDGGGETSAQTGSATGIVINALATDVVQLRGLTIDGTSQVWIGIVFNTGAALHLQRCTIKNFRNAGAYGIEFQPANAAKLVVSDSFIINNGTIGGAGIRIAPVAGATTVVLERTVIADNYAGINAVPIGAGAITMAMADSTIAGNLTDGILAEGLNVPVTVIADRSRFVNNGVGVHASAFQAVVLLSNSTIAGNGTGVLSDDLGVIGSYGNNNIDKNGTDGAPTMIFAQK